MPVARYLTLVKFSHSVFAMPFAMVGLALGLAHHVQGVPCADILSLWPKLVWVLVCMVSARNAAMAFNRWADRRIDAQNPRTAVREIPAGKISARSVLAFVAVNCLVFMAASWLLSPLCFALSPVALAVVLGYSYTKRFTALCHLVLGVGLGLAPVGAYVAVTEAFALPPILLGVAVLLWVAGFDIIYALQDEVFDRRQRLHSIPAALGARGALRLSEALHVASAVCVAGFAYVLQAGPLLWTGVAVFAGLLLRQHFLVKPNDLNRVNLAFFTLNGFASLVFGILAVADVAWQMGWFCFD